MAVRGSRLSAVFLAGAGLVGGGSAQATNAARARVVTISLSDTGKGRWSTVSDDDQGALALNYHWTGRARFALPESAIKHPARTRFSSRGTAILVGTWVGDLKGSRLGGTDAGAYHCVYKATRTTVKVQARLQSGAKPGTVEVVLIAPHGFFPDRGSGATVSCSNHVGVGGPPH